MRKLSKLLAVLLTVCLLCGVIVSVVASAEDNKTPTLNVTEATYNRSNDYNDDTVGSWTNYRGEYAKLQVVEGVNGNKYYSFTYDSSKTTTPTANIQLGWKASASYSNATGDNGDLTAFDYVTVDFDFGTDRYVYTDADGVKHTVDEEGNPITSVDQIPEGCSYDLAYQASSGSYFTLRAYHTANAKFTEQYQQFQLKIVKDANGWYVHNPTYNKTNHIYLSNEIGVFDHMTFVMKNVYDSEGNLSNLMCYSYVNGQYLCETSLSYATYSYVRMEKLTLTAPTYTVGADNFAMAYDNMAVNYYEKDSKLCEGLDTFFDGAYIGTAFYNVDNVVYSKDYVTPNTDRYATAGGKKYYVINAAFDSINNGDTVTTNVSLNNVTIPKLLKNFKVVCENGATFELSATSAEIYNVTEVTEGTTTTYSFYIKKGTISDRESLNLTGDVMNHYNNFSTTTSSTNGANAYNGVNYGYTQIHDGDFCTGLSSGISSGMHRVYKHPTTAFKDSYKASEAQVHFYLSSYRHTATGFNGADVTNYDYVTVDYDFGTTKYSYVDSDGVYHTATEVPDEYLDSAKPALFAGMQIGIDYNGYTSTAPSKYTEGRYSTAFELYIVEDDEGLLYVSANSTYSEDDIILTNAPGQLDHVTFVFDVANQKIVAFVNGEYITETSYATKNFVITNFVGTNVTIPGTHKLDDKYEYVMDNVAVNWYKEAADTATGIDAFMYGDYTTNPLYNCDDVLYNYDYVAPRGVVVFDGGEKVEFIPGLINDALAELENGDSIITSANLVNFYPPVEEMYVEALDGATITLSKEASTYVVEEMDAGLYYIRKLSEDELVKIEILNGIGAVIDSFFLLPGEALSIGNYPVSYCDIDALTVNDLENWYLDAGDGEMEAEGYIYFDISEAPSVLQVYPKFNETELAPTFITYVVDDYGFKQIVGDLSDYDSMANLANKMANAPDGATTVLLYDLNTQYDINSATKSQITISIPAGVTTSLDLNGRTLVHSYGGSSAYGGYMFKVTEGATFNLYSSVEGGAIFQARPHLNPNNSSWGQICAPGIMYTENVTNATINVDGAVDESYKNNFSLNGGSLYYAGSGTNGKVTVNVCGGFYHSFARSGSAVFTLTAAAKTVYINLEDAKFYNTPASYGIFYDYSGTAEHHVVANNCEFVSKDVDDASYRNIYYRQNATSTAVFTNCVLIGAMNGVNGTITLGEGNTCAGFSVNDTTIKLADGVVKTTESKVNYSIAINDHPNVTIWDVMEYKKVEGYNANSNNFADYNPDYDSTSDMLIMDESTIPSGEDITTWTNTNKFWTSGIQYYLNPVIYDKANWITGAYATGTNVYMTYAEGGEDPMELDTYSYNVAGNLFDKAKWIKGSVVTVHPTSGNYGMYKVTDATWTAGANNTYELADYSVTGNFTDMLANATLTNGMTFNLYIPVVEGLVIDSVDGGELSEVFYTWNDTDYYVVSVELAVGKFDATSITVTFLADSLVGGAAKEGTQTLALDIVKYATNVAMTYECASAEAILVKEMMDYSAAVALYIDETFDATKVASLEAFYAIYDAHENCACTAPAVEAEATDVSKLTNVDSVTFTVNGLGMMGMVVFADAGLNVEISYADANNIAQVLEVEYNEDEGFYSVDGIPAAYIDNVMTITVDGVSGTYSLATYLAGNDNALAAALLEYAIAAENYKVVRTTEQ